MRKQKYDKGRWQLERERHHIARDTPPPPDLSASIADIVPNVMKKWGLENRLWEQELADQWESIAGKQVAAHARPGALNRGTLVVFVSHSTWLSELKRYGQKQLLANLQERFGAKIRALRLQLDPDAGHGKR